MPEFYLEFLIDFIFDLVLAGLEEIGSKAVVQSGLNFSLIEREARSASKIFDAEVGDIGVFGIHLGCELVILDAEDVDGYSKLVGFIIGFGTHVRF